MSSPRPPRPHARPPSLLRLASYLRTTFPRDILMPCPLDTKRPLYPYGAGQWTWDDFDHFIASDPLPADFAIVLRDLCVVDADSPEASAALEARFPACATAPAETTKRGRHYYFRRTPLADAAGYFDGCGQRERGLDFKSVSKTGVSGIILVAPSTNKFWLPGRALWEVAPVDIGEDLLHHVAKPRVAALTGGPAELVITFPDSSSTPLRVSGTRVEFLKATDFVAASLSGRWRIPATSAGGAPVVEVPCSAAGLVGLLDVLEHGELSPSTEPTSTLIAEIDQAADMLGLPPALASSARRARVPSADERHRLTFHADLSRLRPSWWRASQEEAARMLSPDPSPSDAALVPVDCELAERLLYEPLSKAAVDPGLWLFAELPHSLEPSTAGAPVLVGDPASTLLDELPPVVVALLKEHRGCLVLAGGAVLGGVSAHVASGADLDLFVHGLSAADSAKVLADIEAFVKKSFAGKYSVSRSVVAVTFARGQPPLTWIPGAAGKAGKWTRPPPSPADRPFQVVLGTHRARSQVLEYFDLAPSKALARFTEADAFVVEALPAFLESLRAMAFWVDPRTWSSIAPARILKYVAKGFECAVPGVRREAFAVPWDQRSLFARSVLPNYNGTAFYPHEDSGRRLLSEGIGILFDAEAEVLRCRHTPDKDIGGRLRIGDVEILQGRLWPVEAATLAFKISGAADSDLSRRRGMAGRHGSTGTYAYIREPFRRDVEVQRGDERRGALKEVADLVPDPDCLFADFRSKDPAVPGRFKNTPTHLAALYDMECFDAVADSEMMERAAHLAADESAEAAVADATCAACGKAGAAFHCAACKSVSYCKHECQAAHWKAPDGHKGVCKALGEARKAAMAKEATA
jgi:hypothetical protein